MRLEVVREDETAVVGPRLRGELVLVPLRRILGCGAAVDRPPGGCFAQDQDEAARALHGEVRARNRSSRYGVKFPNMSMEYGRV
jgi:hypothetical protein